MSYVDAMYSAVLAVPGISAEIVLDNESYDPQEGQDFIYVCVDEFNGKTLTLGADSGIIQKTSVLVLSVHTKVGAGVKPGRDIADALCQALERKRIAGAYDITTGASVVKKIEDVGEGVPFSRTDVTIPITYRYAA